MNLITRILNLVILLKNNGYPYPEWGQDMTPYGNAVLGLLKTQNISAQEVLDATRNFTFKGYPGHDGLYCVRDAAEREVRLAEDAALT